jgi:hypothetical protein
MGVKDSLKVEMVQSHQNYAYKDFLLVKNLMSPFFVVWYFYDFCQRIVYLFDKSAKRVSTKRKPIRFRGVSFCYSQ